MSEREKIAVRKAGYADDADIDYDTLDAIITRSGGFLRSSGGEQGETAEVWHGDKTYVFSGEGLIAFLYGVKDKHLAHLRSVEGLCEYIAKSKSQPPSVFVRDAIVNRAESLLAEIRGGS